MYSSHQVSKFHFKKVNFLAVILLTVAVLALSSCSSTQANYAPVPTEADITACDDFEQLQNPYDGSNETLWDVDGYESFQSDVDYALSVADDSDLLGYGDTLRYEVDDVLDYIEQRASKSEVEYEAEDIETTMGEILDYCAWIREQ